jgi:hypothetical protein
MNLRQILQKIKLAGAPTIGHLSSMIDAFVTKDELTKAVSSITPSTGTGGTGPAGPTGPAGATGATGATGPAGPGLPAGGTVGQIPRKNSSTDYDVSWVANTAGAIAAQFLKNLAATTLTGVAVETRFVSILIPANTFSAGSAFEVTFRFQRNSTTGACGFKIYVNTSDAVGGANILSSTLAAGNVSSTVQRLLTIRSLTETHHFSVAVGNTTDYLTTGQGIVTSNINWAVNQYLVVSLTPAASGQNHTHFSTIITPK